ncbi:hypothetical protein PSP20601_04901 [Pandoraea sputorum]|nr:hypothetical protein PSP20601_04901 [Pandoraea sputorum]
MRATTGAPTWPTALALLPHSQQYRMPTVNVIENPYASLTRMLSVKSAGVLLQDAFPCERHRQHHRIQRPMVKTFPRLVCQS